MARQVNHSGGGVQTTINGLSFEKQVSLANLIPKWDNRFTIDNAQHKLFFSPSRRSAPIQIAHLLQKQEFYRCFLHVFCPSIFGKGFKINQDIWSKMLYPDEVLIIFSSIINDSILCHPIFYIIEAKNQNGVGSVDEKLETCDLKKSI